MNIELRVLRVAEECPAWYETLSSAYSINFNEELVSFIKLLKLYVNYALLYNYSTDLCN